MNGSVRIIGLWDELDQPLHVQWSELRSAGCMYRDQMGITDVPAEVIDANLEKSNREDLY